MTAELDGEALTTDYGGRGANTAGHAFTGNFKIIPYSRNRIIVSKGPTSHVDSNRYRAASALNYFGSRCCKRESVECNALKEYKISIFNITEKACLHCMICLPDFVMHDKSYSVKPAITELCMIPGVRTTNHGE